MNTGGFPHISYIEIKPKPLGGYFNNVEYSNTGVILY